MNDRTPEVEPKPLTDEEIEFLYHGRGYCSGKDVADLVFTIRILQARVEALEGAHDPLIRAATVEWETENRLLREAFEEVKDKLRIQVDENSFQNDRVEELEAAYDSILEGMVRLLKKTKKEPTAEAENKRLREALRLAGIRLDKLVGRLRACHEETGNHELIEESESYATEAQAALAGEKTT